MDYSKLQRWSLGIVAVNKPLDTDIIEVYPQEVMPFVDGQVTDNINQATASGNTADGGTYTSSIDTTVTVKATWFSPGADSNRTTSPDVRRGEEVQLYRFADQDKFFWTTKEYSKKLRKLETVTYAYSDTTDENAEVGPETSYYMEVSTHRGLITIHTSKSNGEPFVYDIQINAKQGSILVQDDIGNFISMDSANVRLELMNSEGSHIDMDRKIITVTAPDTINLFAQTGNINMQAGTDITMNAGNNITAQAGSNITTTAGSTRSDTAQTINTHANTTTNTVPITTFTGNATIMGLTTTTGMSSVAGGSFDVAGPGTFHQNVQFTTLVASGTITSDTQVIAPNIT